MQVFTPHLQLRNSAPKRYKQNPTQRSSNNERFGYKEQSRFEGWEGGRAANQKPVSVSMVEWKGDFLFPVSAALSPRNWTAGVCNGGGGKPQDTPLQATRNIVDVINLHLQQSLEAI